MKLRYQKQDITEVAGDLLIVPIFEDENFEQDALLQKLNQATDGFVRQLYDHGEIRGKEGENVLVHRPPGLRTARLLLMGAGPRKRYQIVEITRMGMTAMRRLRDLKLSVVALYRRSGLDAAAAAGAAVEGLILGQFEADEYKTRDKSQTQIGEIVFASNDGAEAAVIEQSMQRARLIAEATNFTRWLVNQPSNRVTPTVLADHARQMADQYGLDVEVFDQPAMERLGMRSILAVSQGSEEPPRFIVLRYNPAGTTTQKPIALIGKGVTFDTGGISLKPAQSMEEMKADKAGACAVIGAMRAIAQLKPARPVMALVPAVENMPGGRAQCPGDVIETMSGKTVEVINTDAEGRLILADSITYARNLGASEIVDLATLTGACVIALGHVYAGLFCNHDGLRQRLLEASRRAGEKLWPMPLDDEYKKELRSEIADLRNVGSRWGGAITAAKFLEEFAEQCPWAHLDIAGVDLFKNEEPLASKGPTGFGVRTLVELVTVQGASDK